MSRLLLAPMEGLVDDVMRDTLTQAADYDWCVTEFIRVSASVLPAKVFHRISPELRAGSRTMAGTPVRVQLLGSDPERMAASADVLARLAPAGVDLNFGCPAPVVNNHGGGSILLDQPEVLYRITRAVLQALGGRAPLTAKMRLGIHDKSVALEAAQALTEGGAQLLVVHARTRDEGYRPPAHWPWIARIAEAVKVPVVANGEIWTVGDYQRCVNESGCCDVMLGRGAVADPFLVRRIRQGGGRTPDDQDWDELKPLLGHFWRRVVLKVASQHSPGRMKQWLNLLRRNFAGAEQLYQKIRPLKHIDEVDAVLKSSGVL